MAIAEAWPGAQEAARGDADRPRGAGPARSRARRESSLGRRGFFFGLRALGLARSLREILAQILGIVVRLVPARVRLRRPEQFAYGESEARREPESQQKSLHFQPPVIVVRRTYPTTPGPKERTASRPSRSRGSGPRGLPRTPGRPSPQSPRRATRAPGRRRSRQAPRRPWALRGGPSLPP